MVMTILIRRYATRLIDSILEVIVDDVATSRSLLLVFGKDHELLHNIRVVVVVVVVILHPRSFRPVTIRLLLCVCEREREREREFLLCKCLLIRNAVLRGPSYY